MRKNLFYIVMFLFAAGLTVSTGCKKDKDGEDEEPELTDLEKAKKDYNEVYLGTKAISLSWNGTTAGCNPGDITAKVRENVIKRVNYYRRLVGLPDNVTLNTSQNQKCQEAALYMIANHTITHYPSQGGKCYTAGAKDAAGHGNLAISYGSEELKANHSVNAVSGYIEDPGSNNLAVGHRAWILYPQLSAMGTGSCFNGNDQNWAANCLMWGNNLNGSAQSIDYVAYPPNGYIPSALVFPRWSFQIYGADFTAASVTMTDKDGKNIPVSIIHKEAQMGAPDARIAWEPQGYNFPAGITSDTEFNVTVSGVKNAKNTSYSYTVKVFWTDPSNARKPAKKGEYFEIL
jgi:uncharacterized protein YkwD